MLFRSSAFLAENGGSVRALFDATMQGFRVSPIVHEGCSGEKVHDFEDGTIDALFIDGEHSYYAVTRDILSYTAKVKSGGIIAGHDVDYPEIKRALADVGIRPEIVGRCWMYQKP